MEIKHPKFQIFEGKDEQYYFRLLAQNGENILSSEGYKQKASAINGIRSVKLNAQETDQFEKNESESGSFSFSLKAKNGEKIARSGNYATEQGRDGGIDSVQRIAAEAQVEDTTTGFEGHTNPKFQIYKDNAGEFRFRLFAQNGENILASEGYAQKSGAKSAIDSVKNNAVKEDRFERKTSKDEQFFFNLLAGNDQVIGTSELFSAEASRDNSIQSVMKTAPEAPVEDYTLYPLVDIDLSE